MSRFLPLLAILLLPAAAEDAIPRFSPGQQAAAERLYKQVVDRCCLQKPAALRIKAEIAEMVRRGRSEREILAAYTELTGWRASAEPERGIGMSWALFAVAIVAGTVMGILSRRRRPGPRPG